MSKRNDKEELIKLIEENPNLPLVFFTYNEDLAWDFNSTFRENFHCYVDELYFREDGLVSDFEDMVEYYRDMKCDEEELKNLSDDEYDKYIEKWVKNNLKHYEAIVVSVN